MVHRLSITTVLVILCCTVNSAAYSSDESKLLQDRSLGKLISLSDKMHSYEDGSNNPFGSRDVFFLLEAEYESTIKNLPLDNRVNFFWSSMMHLSFDGEYMHRFQEILYADCGGYFIAKLEAYILKEEELQRNKGALYLSKKVYKNLSAMKR